MSRREPAEPAEELTLERVTRRKTGGPSRDRNQELAVALGIALAGIDQRAKVHADNVALNVAEMFRKRVTELESAGGGTERALGRAEAELEQAKRRITELEGQLNRSTPNGELLGDLLKLGGHVAGLLAGERLQADALHTVRRIYATHGADGVTAYLEAVALASSQVLQAEVTSE